MGKLSFFLLLTILVNVSWSQISTDSLTTTYPTQELNGEESTTITESGERLTTEAPAELETATDGNETGSGNGDENGSNTETTTSEISTGESINETQTEANENPSNNDATTLIDENATTPDLPEESSTNADGNRIETTSELNAERETSTQSASETEAATDAPAPICATPGVQPHELDCHQYNECSLEGSADGNLHLIAKSCPDKQAFNTELNRCSRDISSCPLDIQCLAKGTIANPASNSSYYICDPRLDGKGFRIFQVHCASYEIYYPLFHKCYVDPNNLGDFNWDPLKDIYIVKAEMKLLKKQDKLKLKQEADRKKKLEKEAKKKAKEEEKLNKMKSKQEAASFACAEEGNFASQVAENLYISCINKKGVLKATPMRCSVGATFNPESGSCLLPPTIDNNGIGDDDTSASNDEDDS